MTDTAPTEPPSTTRSHEHTLEIAASPDRVWKAIATADDLTNWFPLDADVEPGEGGTITYRWGGFEGRCEIRAWKPGKHLATTWTMSGEPSEQANEPLIVDWWIDGTPAGTRLRLVHSGFGPGASFDDEFDGTRRGWHFELGSLKHYLERHDGQTRHAIWITHPTELGPEEVFARLAGADGPMRVGDLVSLEVGDSFEIEFAGVPLRGVVRIARLPYEFAGDVANLGGGLVRFGHESCSGSAMAHIWLSQWGESLDGPIESRWRDALQEALKP